MLCLYVGGASYSYPDYTDAATGRMLEPSAGGAAVYDVRVAPGRNPTLPLPPGDGRWHAVSGEDLQIADLIAGAEALPEPDAETAADAALEPKMPPETAEGEPGTPQEPEPQDETPPESEPAQDGQDAPEGEPETTADEATDHPEGSD